MNVFPDVAFHGGSLWVCYREDPRVPGNLVVKRDGAVVLKIPLPKESPCFPKLHVWDDVLWMAYHDGTRGHLRAVDPVEVERVLEPCENNDPITFGHRWVAWQGVRRDGWPVTRLDLTTGEVVRAGNGQGTGLSRVLPDGTVKKIDEDRLAVPGYTRPCWAGDLVVAEGKNNRAVFWRFDDGREGVLWPELESFTPRCAVDPNSDRVAIVTWGAQHDVRVKVASRDELAPKPAPPAIEGDVMIRAFSHYGIVAPYLAYQRGLGDTPVKDYIGNAILLVEDPRDPQALVRDLEHVDALWKNAGRTPIYVIQGDGPAPVPERFWNPCQALWCSGFTPDDLGAAVERCRRKRPEIPIIAYLDSRDWPASRPAWLTDMDRPNVQAYPKADESPEAFEAAMRRVFDRVRGYGRYVGISPRFDDPDQEGGAWTVDRIVACMPVYERQVRDYQLVDFLPFADRRGQGMAHHPILRQWAKAFDFAFSERPNRYNYVVPPGVSKKDRLLNILGQSRLAIVVEQDLRDEIRRLLDDAPNNPPPQAVMPDHSAHVARRFRELGLRALDTEDATRAQSYAFVQRMARELNALDGTDNWGMLHKASGNRWPEDPEEDSRSIDFLCYDTGADEIPHVDILSDASGHKWVAERNERAYGPTWGTEHGLVDAERWRAA